MNILPLLLPSMCLLAQGGRPRIGFLSEAFMAQIPAVRKKWQGMQGLLCACQNTPVGQHLSFLPTRPSKTLRFLEKPGPSKAPGRGSDNDTYASGIRTYFLRASNLKVGRLLHYDPELHYHYVTLVYNVNGYH